MIMMKKNSVLYICLLCASVLMFQSCKNDDWSFPDYDHSAVYFAYQYPVRTIVLGEDNNFDTSLDNAHQCEIYAVLSGMYSNGNKVGIEFTVDNGLCNNLTFEDGTPVKAMPAEYYSLAANQIFLDKTMSGAVKVQLNDAFFADAAALTNTYVIPLRMTGVAGADSILQGTPKTANAVRTNPADWDVAAKDYVLYCIKFINPWTGTYLRRGVDMVSGNGQTKTTVRHKKSVEDDDLISTTTKSMKSIMLPFSSACNLLLTFDDNNNCTVASATSGFTATGKGTFVKAGEKKSWGNKDRDALYLDYQVTANGTTTATKDTLVVRDRGIKGIETFSPTYTSK